jgi:hypothetical protein
MLSTSSQEPNVSYLPVLGKVAGATGHLAGSAARRAGAGRLPAAISAEQARAMLRRDGLLALYRDLCAELQAEVDSASASEPRP